MIYCLCLRFDKRDNTGTELLPGQMLRMPVQRWYCELLLLDCIRTFDTFKVCSHYTTGLNAH